MNEADTCREMVRPKLEAAGWKRSSTAIPSRQPHRARGGKALKMWPARRDFRSNFGFEIYEWLKRTYYRTEVGGPLAKTSVRIGSWHGPRDVLSVMAGRDFTVVMEGDFVRVEASRGGPPETTGKVDLKDPGSFKRLEELLGVLEPKHSTDQESEGDFDLVGSEHDQAL
jgi:hypothetical protein